VETQSLVGDSRRYKKRKREEEKISYFSFLMVTMLHSVLTIMMKVALTYFSTV